MREERKPIIDPVRFVQATRDSGYRSFDAAISELIDNALQAGASRVRILMPEDAVHSSTSSVAVMDNGHGMSENALRYALQFGGSTRFNNRDGIGRFGMGLPNSSLSQARRVEVYTWQAPGKILFTYLDLDEILAGHLVSLPPPCLSSLPRPFARYRTRSGTLVLWRKLDRCQPSDWSRQRQRLRRRLGQTFRYFLWSNRAILVNSEPVIPFDPLFLSSRVRTDWIHANAYGDALTFEIKVTDDKNSPVRIRFSELPVEGLADLSNREKRLYGITSAGGVSIVRGGREIDYGWFFMGKRRENYDDWWRCEIQFFPDLDELFGVVHTKQGIRPTEQLRSILTTGLETTARELHRRARMRHQGLAEWRARTASVLTARSRDRFLQPLTATQVADYPHPTIRTDVPDSLHRTTGGQEYGLIAEPRDSRLFCHTEVREGRVTVVINTLHEFYRDIYRPLVETLSIESVQHRKQIELLLLALGRTELLCANTPGWEALGEFKREWSRAIAVFCGGNYCER